MSQTTDIAALRKALEQKEDELKIKDEDIKAKEAAFAQSLQKEQLRAKDREAKEAAKRQELLQDKTTLTKEMEALRDELVRLRAVEEDFKRAEQELADVKKKRAIEQLKYEEEKKIAEESLWDRRRQCEKLAAEVADLKCQTSIVEHKLTNEKAKVGYQDQMQEEIVRYKNQITILEQQLEQSRSSLKTEQLRFARDKKQLEDRITKMQSELSLERQGVNRVELSEKYQADLAIHQKLLTRSLEICSRKSVTLFAPSVDDIGAVETFLTKLEQHELARPTASEELLTVRAGAVTEDQLSHFIEKLQKLPDDKQQRLLHRFEISVTSNLSNSARFGMTSGLPDRTEDPSVLLNHIANVTTQNELLLAKLADLEGGYAPASHTGRASHQNTGGSQGSLLGGEFKGKPSRYLRNLRTSTTHALLHQESGLLTVGRVNGVHVLIESEFVSRVHAVIRCVPSPEEAVIVDLGSVRGTFVNGLRITAPTPLKSNDTISFGDPTQNTFVYVDETPRAASSSPEVTAKVRSRSEPVHISAIHSTRRTPPATPRDPLDTTQETPFTPNNTFASVPATGKPSSAVNTARGGKSTTTTNSYRVTSSATQRGVTPNPIPTSGIRKVVHRPITATTQAVGGSGTHRYQPSNSAMGVRSSGSKNAWK